MQIPQPNRNAILRWIVDVSDDDTRSSVLRNAAEVLSQAGREGFVDPGRDAGYFARSLGQLRDQRAITFSYYDHLQREFREVRTQEMSDRVLHDLTDILVLPTARQLLPPAPQPPIQILIGQLVAGDINQLDAAALLPLVEQLATKVDQLQAPREFKNVAQGRLRGAVEALKGAAAQTGEEVAVRFLSRLLGIE